ncbi:MAG TPA: methylmalonyl-CoA mutase family protein [Candidatus Tectomicrobia bacterium]|jgi:methylmalonyl-CoA mutase N-terminal domain/subunit|nr:methylmalonyl-CoA mutase family protein [Candidatus Tectomicrobia bacterium]
MTHDDENTQDQRARARWEKETLEPALKRLPERKPAFRNTSGIDLQRLYTPEDLRQFDYQEDLGFPGEFPYTRGVHASMYRGRLWTMRLFAGYGTGEDTNLRYKYLLSQGNKGLSVAFDLPTLMGCDPDDPLSEGEVGKCGVSVASLRDMEALFEGIPLGDVTTSMTINAPAAVLLAMYVAVAEQQGVPLAALGGTLQNDILKEYIAQKEWIYPIRPSMRIITDMIAWCTEHLPRWNTISISGFHIREAGATAVQELAFTLYDGLTYVEEAIKAGLDIDDFAPRLSFFFNAHNDFFEEIAKYRAARRLWARELKRRFQPKDERSLRLRFHTQTSGETLTVQQPYNNVVRVAIQALAGVLGGTQSLHTNALDEAYALPTELAARIALRTQQIIAHESGVTNVVDPLGGSYYVETLTNQMEAAASEYFRKLDELGGMIAAIEKGFPQREIREAAWHYQREIERKERIIVGVNDYVMDEEEPLDTLIINPEVEKRQIERVRALRASRPQERWQGALEALRKAAVAKENLMPPIIDAVKAYATVGEICNALKDVFGEYEEPLEL